MTCVECGKPLRRTFAGSVETVGHLTRSDHPAKVATPQPGLDTAVVPPIAADRSRPAYGAGTNRTPGAGPTT